MIIGFMTNMFFSTFAFGTCLKPIARRCLIVGMSLLAVSASHASTPATNTYAENEMPIVLKGLRTATSHAFNRMTTSIEICSSGSSTHCHRVDNVMVDTGSVGLRLQERALNGFILPAEQSGGQDVAECFSFVGHSNIWGKVRLADVHLGGLVASNIPVQVANGSLMRPADGTCPNYNNDPASNGTLGIGRGTLEHIGILYTCDADDCRKLPSGSIPEALRVPNPISRLPKDNDGEIFLIPPATSAISKELSGTLIFGVNSAANNKLDPQLTILPLDAGGFFTTQFDGRSYSKSYIDSGTQTIGFLDPTLQTCTNSSTDYCTTKVRNLFMATLTPNAQSRPIQSFFRIMQEPGIPGRLYDLYDDIVSAGNSPDNFVWGLPFFLEKRLVLVQEGKTPEGSRYTGPFYAFKLYEGD